VFDDHATAQRAVERLTAAGFSRDEISVNGGENSYAEDVGRYTAGVRHGDESDAHGGGIAGFFRRLFGDDADERESAYYTDAVSHGKVVVCVNARDSREDDAAAILNAAGAVDVDHSSSQAGRHFSDHDHGRDEERTMPVVEDELRVGKRMVRRGGVRVYNRVHEEPVEEQVNLREEHVRVDRRPTDRSATDADIRTHDEVIEVVEMAEEPVVEKRTRVVEEVVVGKETTNRTETIRGKVRRSDVNVERLEGDRTYDDDFRRDFDTRYGGTRSAKYETYAPAYQYGYRMASDERYRGREWNDVEPTLRTGYERDYPGSKWEQMKDAIHYGWDKVTRRR
jgi:uncharacterized protein (TIGR02271 family)